MPMQIRIARAAIAERIALVVAGAMSVTVSSTAPAAAQGQKEIAVMLPAAGDPYFKLKSCLHYAVLLKGAAKVSAVQ